MGFLQNLIAWSFAAVIVGGHAVLTIWPEHPKITTQPQMQIAVVGGSASFSISAEGNPAPLVQWQLSTDGGARFASIPNATSTTLTLENLSPSQNGYRYAAVVANNAGSARSESAALFVQSPPVILTNPKDLVDPAVPIGTNASFTASAFGDPVPTVQWLCKPKGAESFSPIAGAMSSTLDITSVKDADNGEYKAVFTNSLGSASTTTAKLLVERAVVDGPRPPVKPKPPVVPDPVEPRPNGSHPMIAKRNVPIVSEFNDRTLLIMIIATSDLKTSGHMNEMKNEIQKIRTMKVFAEELFGNQVYVVGAKGTMTWNEWEQKGDDIGVFGRSDLPQALEAAFFDIERLSSQAKAKDKVFPVLIWDSNYNPDRDEYCKLNTIPASTIPGFFWLSSETSDKLEAVFPSRLCPAIRIRGLGETLEDNVTFWKWRPRKQ